MTINAISSFVTLMPGAPIFSATKTASVRKKTETTPVKGTFTGSLPLTPHGKGSCARHKGYSDAT